MGLFVVGGQAQHLLQLQLTLEANLLALLDLIDVGPTFAPQAQAEFAFAAARRWPPDLVWRRSFESFEGHR